MFDVRDTVAGGAGACGCVYAGLPFDVVKVRCQTQLSSTQVYSGVFQSMQHICRHEGLFALWKGAVPALSSAVIENSVLFTMNGAFQRIAVRYIQQQHESKETDLSLFQFACIGAASGFFSATAITPAEMIKCRLQNQTGKLGQGEYKGPMDCFRKIIRQEGMANLFRGLPAVCARDVPFNFFFFGAYETYTSMLCSVLDQPHRNELSPVYSLFTGGLAGVTGWSIIFPADSIKSRMQISKSISFQIAARDIYGTQGLRGFYRGWSAAVLRAFPANGALFLGYELVSRMFDWMEREG